jgi:hypothetical protein
VASFAALTACRESLPKAPPVDVCVVLTDMSAHCLPFKHTGEEYRLEAKELVGGFWISPKHLSDIELYIKELESLR